VRDDIEDISLLAIEGDGLVSYALVPMDDCNNSVFAFMRFDSIEDKYEISVKESLGKLERESGLTVSSDRLTLKFSVHGNIYEVYEDGDIIGNEDFLKSFITYNGKEYSFDKTSAEPLTCAGSAKGLKVKGEIHLPGELSAGSFEYDFFTVGTSDAVFVRTSIQYPYTLEDTSISTENSSLGRFSDMKWSEAVPMQLTPILDGDISVIKRNFMGDISSFRTQSFPESDELNKKLYSFNHQLTGGFVGLTDGERGLIVANSRQVLNSMAHCPMRLETDGTVRMNPFGTFYGPQRHHWGRAKDQILGTYVLVTPQGKSIAPSYNGNAETAMLALYPLTGSEPSGKQLAEINAFSDGAVVTAGDGEILSAFYGDNVVIREASADGINEKDLKSPILSGIGGNLGKYITRGARAISHIVSAQIKSKK
jgi:hypothetical protein